MADIGGLFVDYSCSEPNAQPSQASVLPSNGKVMVGENYWFEESEQNKLGQGFSATVYMGQEVSSGDKVAVKCVPKYKLTSFTKLKYLDILKLVQNTQLKSFIKILYFEEREACVYVVMKRYQMDLSTYIRKYCSGKLNVSQLSFLAYQLAAILRDLRQLGLVHNDIKQENLLLTNFNEMCFTVVLSDFGISRILSEDSLQLYSFRGPHELCPPEMVRKYTPAVDMWLCGTLLLSAFGRWNKEKMRQVLSDMKRTNILELPLNIPPELKDLLVRMLNPSAQNRLDISGFLGHPFVLANQFT